MRQKFPVKLTDGEQEGFNMFAQEHYAQALAMAWDTTNHSIVSAGSNYDDEEYGNGRVLAALAVFDKLASPLVYLRDAWRELSTAERLTYYPAEEQERLKQEATKASAKAGEILGDPK